MESDKILELQKQLMDKMIPFEKLPENSRNSLHEYMSFRRELSKESDRGCALLAAAHLDFMLETLLMKKMIGNKKHKKSLFDFTGPLGTFSSRILLSYSIGLISQDIVHDLNVIKSIRNEYGHSPSVIGFENENIKAKCESLKMNVYGAEKSARAKFINAVSGISGQIESLVQTIKPFEESITIDLENRKEKYERMMTIVNKALEELK